MSRTPEEEHEFNMARFLRTAVIRNTFMRGILDRNEALDLLSGCLTPGDESTRIDDRELLDKKVEDVMIILNITRSDLVDLEDPEVGIFDDTDMLN